MMTNTEKNIYLEHDDKSKEVDIEKITGAQSKRSSTTDIFKHFNEQAKFDSSDENVDDYENCTNSTGDNDVEEEDDERDLTNLNWLTELRNQTIGFVSIALEEEPRARNEVGLTEPPGTLLSVAPHCQYIQGSTLCETTENILVHKKQSDLLQVTQQNSMERRNVVRISHQPKRPSPAERYEIFLNKIRRDLETYHKSATDYQLDAVEKPPFNYSHIIGMAMLDNGRRMTLQQICSWIEKKFAFFRVRKKWNNSIRHNLSLHSCFRKMGRNKEDRGKGGYWELGVDPKKCDRKRIRNRKSLSQTTKKNLQNQYIKTSRRRQQNLQSLNFQSIKKSTFKQHHEISSSKCGVQLLDATNNNQGETIACSRNNHFLIKTIETNKTHNIHCDEKMCVREMKNRSTSIGSNINDTNNTQEKCDLKEFKNSTEFDSIDQEICIGQISKHFKRLHNVHQDENTLIISSNANTVMPNIQNLPLEQQDITIYTEDVVSEKKYVSSYLPKISESDTTNKTKKVQSYYNNPFVSTSSSSITLDFSAFSTQSIQQKPNVIVEQLIQPSLNVCPIGILNSMPASGSLVSAEYCSDVGNDNYRPYIDGIDEAFQYLRSIDNTRNEDILDNLLDISVSDY